VIILTWIAGIVGAPGVAGAIVAIIAVPAVAIPILQNIVSWLLKCKRCLYALAIIGACLASWWSGHHTAVVACRESELSAELRNREIDLEKASQARSDETARANKIEGDASDQHAKDLKDIAELKKRPTTCVFDDTDAGSVSDDKSGSGNAQPPAGSSKIAPNLPGAVSHQRLLLPLVRNSWLPWRGRKSDAAPHQ